MTTATRKVPSSALCFNADAFEFAAPQEGEGQSKTPIKMRARSGQPINHWFWGNVVHDMAGFHTGGKASIPIDYCHYSDEVLGFLNEFEAKDDGLDVAGEIVSFKEDDRAAEVAYKAGKGVPYQASIFFEPEVIEEVLPGAAAMVNGYELPGPALIIRKWALRGVAVCPYGYDPRTSSQFSAAGLAGGDVEVPTFKLPQELAAMTVTTTPSLSNPPAADAGKLSEDVRKQLGADLNRFVEKFGATNGAAWFTAGKTYEQALELHVDELTKQLGEKDKRITHLKAKLNAIPRGEETPASFSGGGDAQPDTVNKKFAHLGDNLAKVASGIKMPNRK